jgi:hypothetical protein
MQMTERVKVVEQRFGAVVLPHHDQLASENGDPQQGGQALLLITMLLPPFRCANRSDVFNSHAC